MTQDYPCAWLRNSCTYQSYRISSRDFLSLSQSFFCTGHCLRYNAGLLEVWPDRRAARLLLIEFHHHPAPRIAANSKRQVSGDTVLALTALTNTIPYWKKEIPQTWCCFTHFLFYSPQQTVRTRPSMGSSNYFLAQVHSPCYAHDGSVDT